MNPVALQRATVVPALRHMEIVDQEHGGRGFGCRDLEGHLWSVGTYDPWSDVEAEG